MKTYLLLILLLLCGSTNAQTTDTIHWRQDYKLTWDDFQGIPDTNSKWGAVTHSSIRYSYSLRDSGLCIKVFSVFNKKKSWVYRSRVNIVSLKHERTHFDITELFARKFLLEVRKTYFNRKTIGEEIEKMCEEYILKSGQMDDEYDLETDYGLNEIKQEEWSKKVKKLLS